MLREAHSPEGAEEPFGIRMNHCVIHDFLVEDRELVFRREGTIYKEVCSARRNDTKVKMMLHERTIPNVTNGLLIVR
jgi:hypothetical protein